MTVSLIKAALPSILQHLPHEWRGTTFKNSNLLGREEFEKKLISLVKEKGTSIVEEDLVNLGNAEDYLRVSSNISSVLEIGLAAEREYIVSQVFTFSSTIMPIFSVLLTAGSTPVHLYVGENGKAPFTADQIEMLKEVECFLHVHFTEPKAQPDHIVLSTCFSDNMSFIDGVIQPNILYIHNLNKIKHDQILVIRKRMSTPLTTPESEAMLQTLAGITVTADTDVVTDDELAKFYGHLQTLSGTQINSDANPACFTAGLPAICSLWMTLVHEGGADILMASTAYGGSSQLTDLIHDRAHSVNKHTYDITGKNDIGEAVKKGLDKLSSDPSALKNRTVLFMEVPTNPDMKVPDMVNLSKQLKEYEAKTGKEVLLLVDTTFAPGSKVMEKVDKDLTTMTFISMSKSVSRGLTTAGALVAGPCSKSRDLLACIKKTASMLDTAAKRNQLKYLCDHHVGVETRCQKAYDTAFAAGNALVSAVKENQGYDMDLAFVSAENAAIGFTSSTFSFNLPPIPGGSAEQNQGLAQKYVDLLTKHKEFKPCVSFGQDNGLVYATVPATSTQGAIKAEDKAKQAVGGVQLVRLSFPPTIDVDAVCQILQDAVKAVY